MLPIPISHYNRLMVSFTKYIARTWGYILKASLLLMLSWHPQMTIITLFLSESSTVLDLLLQYMYHQHQPDLEDVDFQVLAEAAEVAEKYEVYSATAVCNLGEWAIALHGRVLIPSGYWF